ncbi:MAG: VCBS repeat-containing protein, partial [Candidatus Thermoplasmatota archaeon]|nr:VCBS repeat-containing protein [Candidatus Thermoplasmatota archaeon]
MVSYITDDYSLASGSLMYTRPDGSSGTVALGPDTETELDKRLLWLQGTDKIYPDQQATDWTFVSMSTSHVDSYTVLRNLDGYGVVMMSQLDGGSFGLSSPGNRKALMDWVADGGSLYVIYPPNVASIPDFLGVTYTRDSGDGLVVSDPEHPIVNYPYPAVTQGWPSTYEVGGYWSDYIDDGYEPVITHPDVPSGAVTMVKSHGKGIIVLDSTSASYSMYLTTGRWVIENTLAFIQRNRVEQLADSSTAPAVQSTDHAVKDYFDNIFTYRFPGAAALQVHLSTMDVEDGYDFIQVLDGRGRLHQTLTGAQTDLWTIVVPGDTIHLRLITDGSIRSWGFETDLVRHYGRWVAHLPALDVPGTVTYSLQMVDGAGNTGTSPVYTLELKEPPIVMNITTSPDRPSDSQALTVVAEVLDVVVRDDSAAEWVAGTMVNTTVDGTGDLRLTDKVSDPDGFFASDDAGRIYKLEVGSDMMFTGATQIATLGTYLRSFVAGDFDEDGDIDVVAMNRSDGYLYFLEQTSAWTFSAPVKTGTDTGAIGTTVYAFAVGDFNEDGHLDIVGGGNQKTVRLFAGQGNGSFDTSVVGTVPQNLVSMATGDMDNDGHMDILAVPYSGRLVSFLGHGNGTFTSRTSVYPYYGSTTGVKGADLADMDGDGNLDILINPGLMAILLGKGDGVNFTYGGFIAQSNTYGEVEAVDLDDDGDL